MHLKYQMVVQEVAGTYMAVAIGDDARRYGGILKLNKAGKVILESLRQETTEDAIVAELMNRYEGEEALIRSSVAETIDKLSSEGLIV